MRTWGGFPPMVVDLFGWFHRVMSRESEDVSSSVHFFRSNPPGSATSHLDSDSRLKGGFGLGEVPLCVALDRASGCGPMPEVWRSQCTRKVRTYAEDFRWRKFPMIPVRCQSPRVTRAASCASCPVAFHSTVTRVWLI